MRGFRRAQLRGSDELFRPSETENGEQQAAQPVADEHPAVTAVPSIPPPNVRSLRLTEDEIRILSDAVQHLKFPQKSSTRPSVDDFERLEALRQKLLDAL